MEFHLMKAKLGSLVREMLSAKSQDLVAEFFLQKVLPAFNAFLIAGITLTTGKLRITDGLSIWMCFFIPIQLILNWIQFYRNRSIISTSTEQFPALVNNMKLNQEYEISINNSQMERYKECYPCNLFVPLRSHHCPYCRKCIYVLDHHCFFLGHCVGRKNMKYFILFCFYAAIGTAYGLYHIMEVMTYYRDVSTKESIYFFFPFIFVMYMFDRAAGFECYYVFLLDFGLGACLICVFLTCMGLYSTFSGTTPYEEKRNLKVQDSSSWMANFRRVFGHHGFLNFILPVFPARGPEVLKGYRKHN